MIARQQQIMALLNKRGHLSAGELSRRFKVTSMTIWRDLKAMDELGLLRRVRGGVLSLGPSRGEPDFEDKGPRDSTTKSRIALLAARRFVREGDVVALEGGTTVAALVEHLPCARISILTNSLPVALRVRFLRPQLPVRMVGGWLSSVSGNLTGPEAVRAIARLSADVCFLSATGFDSEVGPSDPNPLEIEAKRALAAISRKVVLLLDSSKFGKRSTAVTLHPKQLQAVVTDAKPPGSIKAMLDHLGVPFLISE